MQHGSLWRSLGSGSAAHRSSTSHAPAPVAVALTLHLKQPWEAAKASRGLGRAACSEAWAKRGMCSRLSVRAAHQEVSGAPSRPKQGPIRSFKSSDYGYTPYNRAKFGARNQSNVRAPPAGVPRWVQELAAHLAQLLADATPGQPIDPQLAAQVLQLLPPIHVNQAGRNGPRGASASESVLKREGSENEEESDGEEGLPVDIEVSDSEDDAAPSSVYDNELRAIMKHFNARGGDDDPNGGTRVRQEAAAAKQNGADAAKAHSGTETNGNADNASQGVLHDGSFFALLHSISDQVKLPHWLPLCAPLLRYATICSIASLDCLTAQMLLVYHTSDLVHLLQGGPGAALAFRNIVHSQCPPLRATTTSPRVILLLINALLSGSNPEAAHAVFLQAATAEARAGAEGEEWTPCWAALSRAARPDLVAEIFRGMKAAGVEPGTQAYTCLMRARGYNPDSGSAGAAAAVEAFFEMKRQGVPRSPVFMAALASAVGFRLGVKGAMEILDYAEEESRNLSESSMHSTWGEMLGCSLSPDAPKELVRNRHTT